jgi:hypothetical protein
MSIPIAQLVEAHVRRLLGSRGVDVLETRMDLSSVWAVSVNRVGRVILSFKPYLDLAEPPVVATIDADVRWKNALPLPAPNRHVRCRYFLAKLAAID